MILELDKVITGSNVLGLPDLEKIANGHRAKAKVAINDNPKTFVNRLLRASDNLVEVVGSLENQIVVDLGAGRNLDGYIFSQIAGAKAYVAVEASHIKQLYELMTSNTELRGTAEFNDVIRRMSIFIKTVEEYDQKLVERINARMQKHLECGAGELPAVLVAEDMLTALKRIPKDSVSILACGIDKCIHPEDDYSFEVESEISRTLHPNGAYIGVCSRFQPIELKDVTMNGDDWSFKRYVKQP